MSGRTTLSLLTWSTAKRNATSCIWSGMSNRPPEQESEMSCGVYSQNGLRYCKCEIVATSVIALDFGVAAVNVAVAAAAVAAVSVAAATGVAAATAFAATAFAAITVVVVVAAVLVLLLLLLFL